MTGKPHFRRTADGSTLLLNDGIQNVVARLGTVRDKASHSTYMMKARPINELVAAYRTAWLPQKVVDLIPEDAVRRWRSWNAGTEEQTKIEAEEKRLGVRLKVQDALRRSRLYGGAAIYIGTKDINPELPLEPERIGVEGITHLTVMSKNDLSAGDREDQPASPNYGEPRYFQVGMQRVHPSRIIPFRGKVIPDWHLHGDYWGDSILVSVFDAMTAADSTGGNIASLIFEAQIDVLSIPRLMEQLKAPGGDKMVSDYLMTLALAKGNNGMLILDGGNTAAPEGQKGGTNFERKPMTFSGLADIWDRMYQAAAGAARIPLVQLLGTSPGGLGSNGEGELDNYHDRIQTMQELEITPPMQIFDECLIRSALGSRPEEIYHEWRSLSQNSDTEKATVAKSHADTIAVLKNTGLFPDEALQQAAVAAITESGAMPGLETSIEELGGWDAINKEREAEEAEEKAEMEAALKAAAAGQRATVPGAAAKPQAALKAAQTGQRAGRTAVEDTAPRTLYIKRQVLNGKEIAAWAKKQGFTSMLEVDDLHVTIAFSRVPVDWMKVGSAWQAKIELPEGGPRLMEDFGEAKVLLFASHELGYRHEDVLRYGGTWDHDDYQPHITISYKSEMPKDIEPYQGKIVLGPEIFQEIREDMGKDAKEVEL